MTQDIVDLGYRRKFEALQEAVKNIYYSAYWTADRPLKRSPESLWEDLRDKADFDPGLSKAILGSLLGEKQQSTTEKDLQQALAIIEILTENPLIKEHLPMTNQSLKKFLGKFD